MTKPKFKLRLVTEEPIGNAQKRAKAIEYLRSRGLYVLDRGTPAKWGVPGTHKAQWK